LHNLIRHAGGGTQRHYEGFQAWRVKSEQIRERFFVLGESNLQQPFIHG
jgi:hypothetical protein